MASKSKAKAAPAAKTPTPKTTAASGGGAWGDPDGSAPASEAPPTVGTAPAFVPPGGDQSGPPSLNEDGTQPVFNQGTEPVPGGPPVGDSSNFQAPIAHGDNVTNNQADRAQPEDNPDKEGETKRTGGSLDPKDGTDLDVDQQEKLDNPDVPADGEERAPMEGSRSEKERNQLKAEQQGNVSGQEGGLTVAQALAAGGTKGPSDAQLRKNRSANKDARRAG